jgi:adenylosuccinate synthase
MRTFSKAYAVIGLGFGDEGKGVAVNSLCKQVDKPVVIRYSGGQQAGHTVTLPDGTSHVFSNFGSGTFQGAPTYWSRHCTFDPVGVVNEFKILKEKGFTPILYIDKQSPITTPFDKWSNVISSNKHGTCGVGVGATFAREERFQSLLVGDLMFPSVFRLKFALIAQSYKFQGVDTEDFLNCCDFVRENFKLVDSVHSVSGNRDYVFESSQGLLLDQHFGFFPHVTRSNVGTENIMEILPPLTDRNSLNLFLVTRAFQTRHGNGPMTNENLTHKIKSNPKETNVLNPFQGEFRRTLLDLDLLKYGMERDLRIKNSSNRQLVITCLDLVKDEYRYTVDGQIVSHSNEDSFVAGISKHLNIETIHRISSPDGTFDIGDLR